MNGMAMHTRTGVHRERVESLSAMLTMIAMLAIVVVKAIKAAMAAARHCELRMKIGS